MNSRLGRALLATAALVLIASALLHASAYGQVDAGVGASGLSPVLAKAYRALWLADSATTALLGLAAAVLALNPGSTRPSLVLVLAAIPAASALCIYHFLGAFPPGHFMLTAAALLAVAAVLPRRPATGSAAHG
jgi:hypothetical protein